MRKALIAGMMALAVSNACAEQNGKRAGYHVTAYLLNERVADPFILKHAKSLASSMFAGIGVGLKWDAGIPPKASCPRGSPNLRAIFLGHILAHEIVHVLQGVAWHSEAGVMKGQWTAEDMTLMKLGSLPFAPKDVQLIRRALERGSCGKAR